MSEPASNHSDGTDRRAKAGGLITFTAVMRDQLGAATFARILERASPATRAIVEKPPLPMSWIEREPFTEMLNLAVEVGFHGRTDGAFELAREQMKRDMSTVYRVLMHLASPQTILRKAASIYATYTRSGKMSARQLGPNEAEVSVTDVDPANATWWAYQRGCVYGVLESAGTKGLEVKLSRGGGDMHEATYHVSWK